MFFKITSLDTQGNPCIDYYDNITQRIYNKDGKKHNFKDGEIYKDLVCTLEKKQQKVSKSAQDIRELRIQLGLKCNFHCKYCNQAPNRECFEAEEKQHKVNLSPKMAAINFCKMLADNNIQFRDIQKIVFWGGEPLVYFKYIKELMPRLKKIYPDAIFSTITNGSLLTDEITDFCIKNRLNLTISHDGPSFNVYRDDKDPLNDPKIIANIERFLEHAEEDQRLFHENPEKYPHKSRLRLNFNTVVTPENSNLDEIYQYLESRFKNFVTFHYESIAKCDERASKIITKFDKETTDKLQQQLFKFGIINDINPKTNPQWSIRHSVVRILMHIINEFNAYDKPYPCDVASDTRLAVDLNGNILACHGADAKNFTVGHLNTIGTETDTKCIPWQYRKECNDCPYLLHCGGGCAIATNKDQEFICENLRIWYGGFFAAAWYQLLQRIIQRIEPVGETLSFIEEK